MRRTLAAEAEQITGPGADSHRLGPERSRTHAPARSSPPRMRPGRQASAPGRRPLPTPPGPFPADRAPRAGLSEGRRRRRRDAEMLLVVRRAERGRWPLDGGRGVRNPT
jgi:hypothetical protein